MAEVADKKTQTPDILHGNIRRCLLVMSVPLVCSMFMDTLNNIIDALWLGRSSTEAFAAVNISAFPIWMMYAIIGIVSVGVNALMAQKLGEATVRSEAKREAEQVASLGIGLSLLLGLAMSVAILVWGRPLLSFMAGSGSSLVDLGYSYLGFFFVAAPIYSVSETLMAILRAHGDTKTPMRAYLLGCGLNIVLDPLFIFGWGPFPRWDVFGAALASNIAFTIATLWMLYLIGKKRLAYQMAEGRLYSWNWPLIRGVLRIGAPPALASCVFSAVYMLLSPIVSSFGVEPVAAIGIGHKLENITYLVCYGVSMTCVTMIGQNVGAKQYERANAIAWEGLRFAAAFSTCVAAAFWFFPHAFTIWFSNDAAVLAEADSYIRIQAIAQIFAGICVLVDGIFAGVGRTWPSMCVSIPCSLLRVPIAYLATQTWMLGVSGVWVAVGAMCVLRGFVMLVLFLAGVWKDKSWSLEPAGGEG